MKLFTFTGTMHTVITIVNTNNGCAACKVQQCRYLCLCERLVINNTLLSRLRLRGVTTGCNGIIWSQEIAGSAR